MKALLSVLCAFFIVQPILAEEKADMEEEIILPASPAQKIVSRYQTDFSFHHDRGFYFSAALGPQWNQSLANPKAKGVRFGGKLNVGWFITDGVTLFGSVWGNFLEASSLIACGPGIAFLFDSTNISFDLSLGVGRVFNAIEREDINNFAESVLAANLSVGKFWWLSSKTSLGITLASGMHGLTLSQGKLSSIGFSGGLSLSFLFG